LFLRKSSFLRDGVDETPVNDIVLIAISSSGDKSLALLCGMVCAGSGGSLGQDENGGYDFDNINEWVTARGMEWDAFKGWEADVSAKMTMPRGGFILSWDVQKRPLLLI
jgi:hypothetical protein